MDFKIIIILFQVFILKGIDGVRNKLSFFPDTESEIPREEMPLHISEKRITTADKESLQAFYFEHPENEEKPLVIYFHGNSGNVYSRFDHGTKLYDMNANVLMMSYRGYAKSTGSPSEKGIYLDGDAAINFAMDKLGYAEKDIIIVGRSLGTTVAVNSSQKRNFKGIILISPLTSGKEMATAMGLKTIAALAGNSFNSYGKMVQLQSPILIIHGTDDEVVPYEMGETLFHTYPGIKKFISIKNGKHTDIQDIDPQQFWGEVNQFINEPFFSSSRQTKAPELQGQMKNALASQL